MLATCFLAVGCTASRESFPVGRWVVKKSRDPEVPGKKHIRIEFRSDSSFVYSVQDVTGHEDRREGMFRYDDSGMFVMKFMDGVEWKSALFEGAEGPILEFWEDGKMRDLYFCIPESR
jgi:hypothetical protein